MHDIVLEEFEKHLTGAGSREFLDHLDACPPCRAEVESMNEIAVLLREMQPGSEAPQPRLGFYNRLTGHIIENQKRSFWSLFSPDAAFFRRVAFASLLLLAGMGSVLVTRETSPVGTDAATIMAQHDAGAVHADSEDRDRLLVTLANYRQ